MKATLHSDGQTHAAVQSDGGEITTFRIARGDTREPIKATLRDGLGEPIDLSDAYRIEFQLWGGRSSRDEPRVAQRAEITDAENGEVRYEWGSDETDVRGRFKAAFVIRYGGGGRQRVPNTDPLIVIVT